MNRMKREDSVAWLKPRMASGILVARKLGESYSNPNVDLDFGEELTLVHTDGGEGDGAPISKVFLVKVQNEEFYFRISGMYSSWDETEWDSDITLVEPREVVVTQYFPV